MSECVFVSKGPCFLIAKTRHACGIPQVNKSTLADHGKRSRASWMKGRE